MKRPRTQFQFSIKTTWSDARVPFAEHRTSVRGYLLVSADIKWWLMIREKTLKTQILISLFQVQKKCFLGHLSGPEGPGPGWIFDRPRLPTHALTIWYKPSHGIQSDALDRIRNRIINRFLRTVSSDLRRASVWKPVQGYPPRKNMGSLSLRFFPHKTLSI